MADRQENPGDAPLPDLEGRTFTVVIAPVVARDALLVTDGRAADRQFADGAGVLHMALNASVGERSYEAYHIQNVNGYHSRFKVWLAPFQGVASKYLAS